MGFSNSAVMAFLLLAAPVAHAQFTYTVTNNSATLTGYTGPGGTVSIPGSLGAGPSVVSIANNAFLTGDQVTNIYIPANITNIDSGAFTSCTSLTALTVDGQNPFFSSLNGVLFDKAFTTLVQFPEGLAGDYAIPAGVTAILPTAFDNCVGPLNLEIPGSVTTVASNTFFVCYGLTSVILDNGVQSVGPGAFFNCLSLTNLTIPASLNDIESQAFAFSGLSSLVFPGSVTNIAYRAFYGCYNLATVTFLKGVTNVQGLAFGDCFNLVSVIINGNVPSVGSAIFDGDSAVSVFYIPGSTGTTNYFGGLLPLPWNPVIQTGDGSFGVQGNQFGFNVTGTSNLVVVVQGSTSLASPAWLPLQTLFLTNGSAYFSAPVTNSVSGFFRLSTP
jgi:hypothetical protein